MRPPPTRDPTTGGLLRRGAALSLALATGLGCGTDAEFLALPDTSDFKTLILANFGTNEPQTAVFDLYDGAPRLDLLVPSDARLELEALLYLRTPTELGLEPGLLEPLASPAGRALWVPDAAFEALDGLGAELAWRPLSPAASAASRLRVAGTDPCPRPNVTYLGWGSLVRPRFALALPSGEVLLGGEDAALFVLDESGLSPTANPTERTVTTAALDTLGPAPRLWLRTREGLLYEGPATLPLSVSPVNTASIPRLLQMAASISEDGTPEVFSLTEDGHLRLDVGTTQRVLHTFDTQAIIPAGAIARGRVGEAVAARYGDRVPVRYRDGELTALPPPSSDLESIGALAWDGAYLGATSLGRLVRLEDGTWRERGRGGLFDLFALLPVPDGAWVAGSNGYLAKLPYDAEACALVPTGGSLIVALVPLAGRHMLAVPGDADPGSAEIRLAILRFD